MAVTKRTRYEVLKRDNFTCRYCRSVENPLRVDHVTPVALGGDDKPGNLVAACHDCNAGKGSTSPTEAMVEDVRATDMKWAGAIQRVARARARQHKKRSAYVDEFVLAWGDWHLVRTNGQLPKPAGWQASIERFYDLGVPVEEMKRCVRIAAGNDRIDPDEAFRYFAGCVWRVVTEIREAAQVLLDAEAVSPDGP